MTPKKDGDRIFTARVSPERDAELFTCISSRVDGQGMTFKEFLLEVTRKAYPDEMSPGTSSVARTETVPAPERRPESEPSAEAVTATVSAPTAAGTAASPPGGTAEYLGGYGIDSRLDSNLRRDYLDRA